jgi:hypothetical protein
MKVLLGIVVVIVLIVLIGFGQYVGVRNTLVTKDQTVKAAWSQVDIVLQRRADLIPNLVETVKGYAQQEQTVFGDIARQGRRCFRLGLLPTKSQPISNSMARWGDCC